MTEHTYKLFWPQFIGPYESDLHSFLKAFGKAPTLAEKIEIIETTIGHLPAYPNSEIAKLRCNAFLCVLEDLLRQRWEVDIRQGKLYLKSPDWTKKPKSDYEVQQRKEIARQSLKWEREAQFEKGSVVRFIRHMEQERPYNGRLISVRNLIADGAKLAEKLRGLIGANTGHNHSADVESVIQPYLCLINRDERCPHTGYLLQEIWRYFRYTWATPYHSTPGRQMFYLVRDAAMPFHPVIGIAALGSSMVQLTVRDNAIGWTPKAFETRIFDQNFSDSEASILAETLRNILTKTLSDIDTEGLVSKEQLSNPSDAIINQLVVFEKANREKRTQLLKEYMEFNNGHIQDDKLPLFHPSSIPVEIQSIDGELDDHAHDALYRAKRAGVLRQLLEASIALNQVWDQISTVTGLQQFWKTNRGQRSIRTLLRENKKRHIGINMMDIIVCGAIAPYNYLLGGKLVSMLLLSPQVIQDYQTKYSNYASTIASRMKGQDVKRDARLVFLGTTSLFDIGSSQYNRISIPVPGTTSEKIDFINMGLTEGYGSVHFSVKTVEMLSQLDMKVQEARLINNRFGEGVNPKLRKVRSGLTALGISSVDTYLKHHSQRIVYGIPLGRSSYRFLRGETDNPDYLFPMNSPEQIMASTQYITAFWIKRWLAMRIQNPTYLELVEKFSANQILISTESSVKNKPTGQNALKF